MALKFNFRIVFQLVLILLAQLFLLRDLGIGGMAFLFIYTMIIIKAPLDFNPTLLFTLAFFIGWLVDVFYDTHGMHAFSLVLIAFLRPKIISILTPANGYDEKNRIGLRDMTWLWYLPYVGSMLFIHHFVLFFLEASDMSLLGITLLKVICSTIFGTLVFVLIELFSKD